MQCYINMQKDYSELGELIAMVTGSPVGVVTVHSLYGSWLRPSSTTNLIWEQNKQAVGFKLNTSKPNTEQSALQSTVHSLWADWKIYVDCLYLQGLYKDNIWL